MDVNYKMGDTVMGIAAKQKDLGITKSADMKVSEQCGIAASNSIGIVRHNLEYSIEAWRTYPKKDIETLERIKRRATKMIPQLGYLSYDERLQECGLTTLETRRLRGDQIVNDIEWV